MMSDAGVLRAKPLSVEGFLAVIEWAGGIEAAIAYGLRPEDCANPTLAALWAFAVDVHDNPHERPEGETAIIAWSEPEPIAYSLAGPEQGAPVSVTVCSACGTIAADWLKHFHWHANLHPFGAKAEKAGPSS